MKIEDFIKAQGGEVVASGETNREELASQEVEQAPEVQEEPEVIDKGDDQPVVETPEV